VLCQATKMEVELAAGYIPDHGCTFARIVFADLGARCGGIPIHRGRYSSAVSNKGIRMVVRSRIHKGIAATSQGGLDGSHSVGYLPSAGARLDLGDPGMFPGRPWAELVSDPGPSKPGLSVANIYRIHDAGRRYNVGTLRTGRRRSWCCGSHSGQW